MIAVIVVLAIASGILAYSRGKLDGTLQSYRAGWEDGQAFGRLIGYQDGVEDSATIADEWVVGTGFVQ